ncbi:MAG: PQQ-binding-like beta-propeller repeat protein [Acidobacteriaceae bacterium]|nr:PQQ-binding-like beta-propeller repeat protein [Acidobacteriaceae bacterium]
MKSHSTALLLLSSAFLLKGQTDWPATNHDLQGTRYSTLTQITKENVGTLVRAWTYHMGKSAPAPFPRLSSEQALLASHGAPRGFRGRSSEAIPVVIGGVMYLSTANSSVVALQPETGRELWSYHLDHASASTRGVSYWSGDKQSPAQVIFGTTDGRLISLNARTGKPVPGFGNEGIVDMKQGVMNGYPDATYGLNSPPVIYRNLVITGAAVQEFPSLGAAGDTRAWDIHNGKLVWQFHSVARPGETGSDTWGGDSWEGRSGTNVWGFMTIDPELGMLYMPFGQPTYDYYGGDRKGQNLFGDCIVAVDAMTGKLNWYFQTVHHDLWDYDLSGPPVLFTVDQNGTKIPAVAEISKTGLLYVLDRRTGKPVFGMEERPVPQSDVPGEQSWPTQPFPLKPPPLARNSFNKSEITTVTPEQEKFCTDLFTQKGEGNMINRGPFTPFASEMSVVFPGTLGGGNWNPMSFDPKLGYLFVNTQDLGAIGKIAKNKEGARTPYSRTSPLGQGGGARFWNPDDNMPCQNPPWGRLIAVNVNTGDIAWQVPLGITESLPEGQQNTGTPNLGGSLATAGGLVFIGATIDSRFRAFDSKTGKELWVTKLEAGAHTAPITYKGADGRQYIVVTATGGGFLADPTSADVVAAYALPIKGSQNGLVSIASSIQATQPGHGDVTLPDGPGKEVFQRMCLTCHPVETVLQKRRNPAAWQNTVDDMVSRGAKGSRSEIETVVKYLSTNYSQ